MTKEYTAGSLGVLKGLEGVRKRPGMYIGGTDEHGLHHLIWEIVDNSVDEAMAHHCTKIVVTLHKDGSCSVEDNGRGIPTDIHPQEKISGVEVALTMLHAGGKFDGESYAKSGGLHGVGVSVVNALSEWTEVRVERGGKRHEMRFQRGKADAPLRSTGKAKGMGTMVRFKPDVDIFKEIAIKGILTFDRATVETRLRQTAFLTSGLNITLIDERVSPKFTEVFEYKNGVSEMVAYYNKDKTVLFKPVYCSGSVEGVDVDVAIQYNNDFDEQIVSFANTVQTGDGGTHVTGFRTALTHAVMSIPQSGKKKIDLQGTDLSAGLVAVVAVRLADPHFQGQTKNRLNNPEAKTAVQTFVGQCLKTYFVSHPKVAKAIMDKAAMAARLRESARKQKELAKKEKNLLEMGVGADKLAECSYNDPEKNELFLTEGDSAGGSAKMGRDRRFQAILPLRGKILNVEKASMERMFDNEEIKNIVTALGTGLRNQFEIADLRYHKIVLMADADVDGAHIKTLLLTLFFRHFPELITRGHVYLAQPPLYRVRRGKVDKYAYSDEERDRIVKSIGGEPDIQRYKGLGEMDFQELWSTTMNPATRTLLQVTVGDAEKANKAFSLLMGDEVAPRREWITDRAEYANNVDV